ncbi:unnamed protein product [Urochloa humidicola]
MKRTRAQQPKAEDTQDPTTAATATKPQRRAKQPRQPKAAGCATTKKPTAAATARAAAAAAGNAGSVAASPVPEMAPTVPDACAAAARREGEEKEAEARPVECCWDMDGGLDAAAWWTWGVDEEKLLGWFPFVEEDFRCAGGRAGDAEVAAFDHDIWSIW